MNVGYCNKCNNVEGYNTEKKCGNCGGVLTDLGVTIDEWNSMSDSEMIECVENINSKKAIKQAPLSLKSPPGCHACIRDMSTMWRKDKS